MPRTTKRKLPDIQKMPVNVDKFGYLQPGTTAYRLGNGIPKSLEARRRTRINLL